MKPASVQLVAVGGIDALGQEWDPLFAAAAELQSTRAWFAACAEAALPPDTTPEFLAITDATGPLALFPMAQGPGRRWASLTTPYTCAYQPLLRPDVDAVQCERAMQAFARYCRRWPLTRLEALDPEWPGLATLRRGLAGAGLPSRTFTHFGNWHEVVPDRSWDRYLQARPGALRETIRRRTRAAERDGSIRLEIARAGQELESALLAYEFAYARSWKEPEPFPQFNAALVRNLADTGMLRIGVMWTGERPIAAQYWSIVNGKATVLKLAHDEAFKALSPGTVLTAVAIRHLIEIEGATELDFGRGDDPYKRAWVSERRSRIGLLGANPMTAAGAVHLLRHDVGVMVRRTQTFFEQARRRRAIRPA